MGDDAPLTKIGREAAKRAGVALRSLGSSPFAAVYASPFYRCLQTANEVAAELGVPLRVEPGLAELCTDKIYESAPLLRDPEASLAGALTRAVLDVSTPPVKHAFPQWPEMGRDAGRRVLETAKALAARHPGHAICLVCHSHSVVEITRHLAVQGGGGAASSTAPYCALSHISPTGTLLRCLDQAYSKLEHKQDESYTRESYGSESSVAMRACGYWGEGWRWLEELGSGEQTHDAHASVDDPGDAAGAEFVDSLLNTCLDDALEKLPAFRQVFARGDADMQAALRRGWSRRDDSVRVKLHKAFRAGLFQL